MKTYMRIVIIGLFYFYQFSLANILVSLGGPIQTAFNLKPEQLGWIGSLYFISNVIFLLVAGWLIDTFNARKIVLSILLASIALVLLSALIPNLYVFATSRFLLGICGTFGLIGSFKLCANYVDSKQFATMSGIVITLGMVGSFFISMPFSVLLDYLNWQWALVVVGAIGILIFIAIFLIIIHFSGNSSSIAYIVCGTSYAYDLSNSIISLIGSAISSVYSCRART